MFYKYLNFLYECFFFDTTSWFFLNAYNEIKLIYLNSLFDWFNFMSFNNDKYLFLELKSLIFLFLIIITLWFFIYFRFFINEGHIIKIKYNIPENFTLYLLDCYNDFL